LYQNFLITGTIGSGKTSSAMYPFTEQLIKYNSENPTDKIGMLILDVKGNYYNQVKNYVNFYNLQDDLIVIGLNSGVYYNPLHKPNLKPLILANRLKTILTLFSENNSESYWLDKAEQILAEAIKLCRLYNNNYVTFSELHKLITVPGYYKEKIRILKDLFISSKLNNKQVYELNECLNFFQKEFEGLDSRTKGILISEITRITNTFISDYDVFSTFSPEKNKLNFLGFHDVVASGKIVVLNMNISEYSLLAKIIATYLKLDFQTEILSSLSSGIVRKTAFICDEYDKYCTKTDSDFFSLSRESKCINIVSTQSYSSLKNTLKDEASVKVVTQNLINKIWFRTDDLFTIEEAQKQLGKEDKKKISKTFSESAKETNFNYFTNSLNSLNSNISEPVASVDKNGVVTLLTEGETIITVTPKYNPNHVQAQCIITIKEDPITEITTDVTHLDMIVGDIYQVTTTFKPEKPSDPTLNWSVLSGEKVVSVDEEGRITAISAGSAVVMVIHVRMVRVLQRQRFLLQCAIDCSRSNLQKNM